MLNVTEDDIKAIAEAVKKAQCLEHSGHAERIKNVETGLKDHIATHWKFYAAVVTTAGVVVGIVALVVG